jgi:hypothetical protein
VPGKDKRKKDTSAAKASDADEATSAASEKADDGGDGVDAKEPPAKSAKARKRGKDDAKADETTNEASAEAASALPDPTKISTLDAIGKKRLIWIGVIAAIVWAFTINTGSGILLIIVSVITVIFGGLLLWAILQVRKQRRLGGLLQGAVASPEARREALEKLKGDKDAGSPTNLFARAQLMAQDDPSDALELLNSVELKQYHPSMQDDVSLLKTQLCLGMGRTQDARKAADLISLDNPQRAKMRPLAGSIVAEAWARTGKSKEALALLESIEVPKDENADQIAMQIRVAKVFAKFAGGQRQAARTELVGIANVNVEHLGRFLAPQFRVHPELQKLARQVLEGNPAARKMAKAQAAKQVKR